jgi:isocitrate/isopropylmalate dehydrogenase
VTTTYRICLLPGDGIGPEITAEAVKVLDVIAARGGVAFEFSEALLGGVAIDETGTALPDATLEAAMQRTQCYSLPSADRSGIRPTRPSPGPSKGSSESARRSVSMRTCGR